MSGRSSAAVLEAQTSSAGVSPEHFRRYKIIRKLAEGGMGEIFLARQTGIAGFAKDVVIKRITSHYATEPLFVSLFLQEARIAALLDHPNIVQIYELGKQEESYFIVMEYVPGWSLSRILEAVEGPLPLTLAVQIAAAVAEGLQFVHKKKDQQGQPLHLIHRDISPPNILISTSGHVKITDFGIAKARSSAAHTRAGEIKGKYAYLSPEQARGELLDHRSDMYSLGLVLYEMTTGLKAYDGTYLDVLQAAGNGEYRLPAEVVHGFPEDLQAVIMRTLAQDRERRYPSCKELYEDLMSLLVNRLEAPSSSKIGQLVQDLIEQDEANRRGRAARQGSAEGQGSPGRARKQGSAKRQGSAGSAEKQDSADRSEKRGSADRAEIVFEGLGNLELMSLELDGMDGMEEERARGIGSVTGASGEVSLAFLPPRKQTFGVVSAASLVVVAVLVLIWAFWMPSRSEQPHLKAASSSRAAPPRLEGFNTTVYPSKGDPSSTDRKVVSPRQRSHRSRRIHHVQRRHSSRTSRTSRSRRARPQQMATVSITSTPVTDVYLGKRMLGRTPLQSTMPRGRLTLSLRNDRLGLRTIRRLSINTSQKRAHFTVRKGLVSLRVGPGRLIRIDGKLVGRTPLRPLEVYEGRHTVTVVHPYRYRKQTFKVTVRGNQTTLVSQMM